MNERSSPERKDAGELTDNQTRILNNPLFIFDSSAIHRESQRGHNFIVAGGYGWMDSRSALGDWDRFEALVAEGDFRAAVRYREKGDLRASDAPALADIYAYIDEPSKARLLLEEAFQRDPRPATACRIVELSIEFKMSDPATRWRRWLETHHSNDIALLNLDALARSMARDYRRARALLAPIVTTLGNFREDVCSLVKVRDLYVETLMRQRRWREAVSFVGAHQAQASNLQEARAAWAYWKLGNRAAAQHAADSVLLSPFDFYAAFELAAFRILSGEPERALPLLSKLSEIRPSDPRISLQRARALIEMHEPEGLEILQKLSANWPGDVLINWTLARQHLRSRQYRQAWRVLRANLLPLGQVA